MAISNLKHFKSKLGNLTTTPTIFKNAPMLESFEANMEKLGDFTEMFSGCKKLTSFTGDIGTQAAEGAGYVITAGMFQGCSSLV